MACMDGVQRLIGTLLAKGWTYSALGENLGVGWDSVKAWRSGKHSPRAYQAVVLALTMLLDQQPPPKRRYGPDAPQHRRKKSPAEP
jgi:hypothetical protein